MEMLNNNPNPIPAQVSTPVDDSKIFDFLSGVKNFILESIEAVIVALFICIFLYLFIITPHEVLGTSMYPTFEDGEYLIANKINYKFSDPQRGDVVIFRHNATQDYIKRIIGMPGETISLRNGKILVDDQPLDESYYLDASIYTNGGSVLSEGEDYVVPEDRFFVMGDNRQHSSDSRVFGAIMESDIKGRAWLVYFPFNNARVVNHVDYSLD